MNAHDRFEILIAALLAWGHEHGRPDANAAAAVARQALPDATELEIAAAEALTLIQLADLTGEDYARRDWRTEATTLR